MTVAMDGATGRLWLSDDGIRALVGFARRDHAVTVDPGFAELTGCGLVELAHQGGNPSVNELLNAVANPALLQLELSYADQAAWVWADFGTAVLAMPASDEGLRLVLPMHLSLLPLMLSKLVDLRPLPHEAGDGRPVAVGEVEDVTRRWTLRSHWVLDDHRTGGTTVEAIDSPQGWWRVTGSGADACASPTTSSALLREIVRMVMRRDVDG